MKSHQNFYKEGFAFGWLNKYPSPLLGGSPLRQHTITTTTTMIRTPILTITPIKAFTVISQQTSKNYSPCCHFILAL